MSIGGMKGVKVDLGGTMKIGLDSEALVTPGLKNVAPQTFYQPSQ